MRMSGIQARPLYCKAASVYYVSILIWCGQLESSEQILEPKQNRLTTVLKRTGTEPKQQVARIGQLEWFNSNATGLGDLEVADALKKVARRSVLLPSPGYITKRSNSAQYPEQRPLVGSEKLAPILLRRRTESLLEDNDANYEEETQSKSQQFPLFGEFGSRISFLTTRKLEPRTQFALDSSQELPGIFEMVKSVAASSTGTGDKDDTFQMGSSRIELEDEEDTPSRVLISLPKLLQTQENRRLKQLHDARQNRKLEDLETATMIVELNSNYLPRIARKVDIFRR